MKKAQPMENKPPTRSQKRCQQRKTAMQNLRGMFEMLEERPQMDKYGITTSARPFLLKCLAIRKSQNKCGITTS